MKNNSLKPLVITYIGGPTALVQWEGWSLLTDPTFDPAGSEFPGSVTLVKTQGPAVEAEDLGAIDLVLLSHDEHGDNLDKKGREVVGRSARVATTLGGQKRLGLGRGLAPWETWDLEVHPGCHIRVTATPARHGPAGIEALVGEVVGFVVSHRESGRDLFYMTGDTCWFDGVAEVARRFDPAYVLLFAGAAQTRGKFHLTMDTNEAIETSVHFPRAKIVPLHHEGWKHFTQGEADLRQAFTAVGRESALVSLVPGQAVDLPLV